MTDLFVGQALSRVDEVLKVTGRATYAAEHPLPGLVYGVIVSSTISRGTVTSIGTDRALALPGVLRVLTDLSGASMAYTADQVHFFGQSLAIVIATSPEAAEHGASLVDIAYAPQPCVTDMDDPSVTPTPATMNPDYSRGDPDAALVAGPITLDHTFTVSREHHNPLELPSTIAQWDGDQLTLYDKTQWVHATAASVSSALGVPTGNVRVISLRRRRLRQRHHDLATQPLAGLAAREMRRPVKIVLTRKQMYTGIVTSISGGQLGIGGRGRLRALGRCRARRAGLRSRGAAARRFDRGRRGGGRLRIRRGRCGEHAGQRRRRGERGEVDRRSTRDGSRTR
jgi:xanthine dehydrogenase YagR molybdenum-binding subunit